jgi:hypothetical protein
MTNIELRQRNTPETFGPTPDDIARYSELLAKLDSGEKLGFNPRFNAEAVSKRLDDAVQGEAGTLGLFTTSEEGQKKVLDEESALKLAQQRYIAGALGFKVGPNRFGNGTVGADVEYPDASLLPDRPQRGDDGTFRQADGTPVSQVQADAIYAGHFLAAHPETFKRPAAFRKVFERIREGALSGSVQINLETFADDKRGARSFIRQAARLMGYEVGEFIKDDDSSTARMAVTGTRKGFESQKSSFFDTFPRDEALLR